MHKKYAALATCSLN